MLRFVFFICVLFCMPAQAAEQFPADAGFINVRDFGAKADGKTDDTKAINAALTASGGDTGPLFWQQKIVYLPNGTYLVSAPIEKRYTDGRYASGAILIGESREKTLIQLADGAAGYADPAQPKAVIFTAAKLLDGNATSGGKDYTNKGEGNDAFANFIENMTIDTGANNAGAVGIDYLANNLGAVRNVSLRGQGAAGIALTRKWPGPALLQHISVDGFDIGIDVAHTEYGMTLDNIQLRGQKQVGLRNNHNIIAAHGLHIQGAPVPLLNQSKDGLLVLVDSILDGKPQNHGYMHLRGVKGMDGIYDGDKRVADIAKPWSLAAKPAPQTTYEPTDKWVAVKWSADATEAIRAAFASGAATVYFPHGVYEVSDNIVVPASVKRIVGMMSTIRPLQARGPNFGRGRGIFQAENNISALTIEKLAFDNSDMGEQVAVEALGTQPLVLRDVVGAGVTTLKRNETAGEAFIENTCCGKLDIAGKKGVWARQLNTEGPDARITNNGAPLWVLGFKTEQNCTVLDNRNGATSELLGGLIYMVHETGAPLPAFRNNHAKLLLSYGEEAFKPGAAYATHLQDNNRAVTAKNLPARGIGRMAPLLTSQ